MEICLRPVWLRAVASIALLSVACTAATAATISYSDPFSLGVADAGGNPDAANLTFNDFNSALGTLTGVTVQYTVNAGAYDVLAFLNTAAKPSQTFTAGSVTGESLTLTSTANGVNLSNTASFANITGATGTITSSLYSLLDGTASTSAVTTSGAASNISSFIGTGSQTLVAEVDGATQSATFNSYGGTVFVGHDGFGAGTATVTYTYTPNPVPLPASAWLMLSGIAGLGAMIRRRCAA